jgi:hypothetical protein
MNGRILSQNAVISKNVRLLLTPLLFGERAGVRGDQKVAPS